MQKLLIGWTWNRVWPKTAAYHQLMKQHKPSGVYFKVLRCCKNRLLRVSGLEISHNLNSSSELRQFAQFYTLFFSEAKYLQGWNSYCVIVGILLLANTMFGMLIFLSHISVFKITYQENLQVLRSDHSELSDHVLRSSGRFMTVQRVPKHKNSWNSPPVSSQWFVECFK